MVYPEETGKELICLRQSNIYIYIYAFFIDTVYCIFEFLQTRILLFSSTSTENCKIAAFYSEEIDLKVMDVFVTRVYTCKDHTGIKVFHIYEPFKRVIAEVLSAFRKIMISAIT